MNRTSVFKLTSDDRSDWAPAYCLDGWHQGKFEPNLVEVFYNGKIGPQEDSLYRVSVWGQDDFGMERDFDNENEAIQMFLTLVQLPEVNQAGLTELGFIVA